MDNSKVQPFRQQNGTLEVLSTEKGADKNNPQNKRGIMALIRVASR
jgi:hypothetical protein